MVIHTFGDSHSIYGWSSILVKSHSVGPLLCYSFGVGKLERLDIRNFGVNDGDVLIFCLGEIDCRCHINKHITDSNSYMNIIDDIVNNYFEAIKSNIDVSNMRFRAVCVYNIVPPIRSEKCWEHPEYPFLGTNKDRVKYAKYFNACAKEKCKEYGYIFIDIYDKYCDEEGMLIFELSDGNVHLGNSIHTSQFIRDNLL